MSSKHGFSSSASPSPGFSPPLQRSKKEHRLYRVNTPRLVPSASTPTSSQASGFGSPQLSLTPTSFTSNLCTREVAALHFLRDIPLGRERELVIAGWNDTVGKEAPIRDYVDPASAPSSSHHRSGNAAAAAAHASAASSSSLPSSLAGGGGVVGGSSKQQLQLPDAAGNKASNQLLLPSDKSGKAALSDVAPGSVPSGVLPPSSSARGSLSSVANAAGYKWWEKLFYLGGGIGGGSGPGADADLMNDELQDLEAPGEGGNLTQTGGDAGDPTGGQGGGAQTSQPQQQLDGGGGGGGKADASGAAMPGGQGGGAADASAAAGKTLMFSGSGTVSNPFDGVGGAFFPPGGASSLQSLPPAVAGILSAVLYARPSMASGMAAGLPPSVASLLGSVDARPFTHAPPGALSGRYFVGGAYPGRRLDGVPPAGVISIPERLRCAPLKDNAVPNNNNSSNNNNSLGNPRQGGQTDDSDNARGAGGAAGAGPAPPPAPPVGGANNARVAMMRQWEMKVAHGLFSATAGDGQPADPTKPQSALLEGRVFFAADKTYPMAVFSVLKYCFTKEASKKERRKVELEGGGGTTFETPSRDWRGTSYRAIIFKEKAFGTAEDMRARRVRRRRGSESAAMNAKAVSNVEGGDDNREEQLGGGATNEEEDDDSSSGSDNEYVPGFLDDVGMVHGRHRHTMKGDKIVGPLVSSIIQFVSPQVLKAELNKQYRDRFDRWEPPKEKWKYIGANPEKGIYTLCEPGEERGDIRMPPSLTLSKIRAVKTRALFGCHKGGVEVATVALACVYFERLCLDCRVDKLNRKLTMGACLMLAYKFNEPHVNRRVEYTNEQGGLDEGGSAAGGDNEGGGGVGEMRFFEKKTYARPTTKRTAFDEMMDFLITEWHLEKSVLLSAEWGVFVALSFKLHATPVQYAFHYKRLMKTLGLRPLEYLGAVMYQQWEECYEIDMARRERKRKKIEHRKDRHDQKLIMLQLSQMQPTIQQQQEEYEKKLQERVNERGVKSEDDGTGLSDFSSAGDGRRTSNKAGGGGGERERLDGGGGGGSSSSFLQQGLALAGSSGGSSGGSGSRTSLGGDGRLASAAASVLSGGGLTGALAPTLFQRILKSGGGGGGGGGGGKGKSSRQGGGGGGGTRHATTTTTTPDGTSDSSAGLFTAIDIPDDYGLAGVGPEIGPEGGESTPTTPTGDGAV